MEFSEVSREEEIVHELCRFLEGCSDIELIEKSFIESVGRLTAARSVQWIRGPVQPSSTGDGDGDGRLEITLRAGSVARGRLLVLPPSDQPSAWSPATVKRLKTLCTMAASALLRHDRQNAELSQPAGTDLEPIPNAPAIASARTDRDLDETKTKENHFAAAVFQDATFLHAILPFALGVSRRHGEPLSLLCVAIDRLSGIHELLGRDWADRAVRNVGAHIAAMIRDSDIVARLDDDRIIVVLPRALIPDAWNLARKICRTVETTPALLAELPVLTVSIGVAEFPTCANDVYTLLDAADHALSMARNQGRNQAVAATTLNPTDPVNRARCAS
jgi:diguanylate cyclase (GGDEF)-like protein